MRMPASAGGSGSPFPATRWSLVGRAATRGTENGRLALGELVQIYLPALRAHLVSSMRIEPHRADDLLQSFLADKVVEQNTIAQADRNRGRFRSFLLTALQHFAIDELRKRSTQSRAPDHRPLDVDDHRDDLPGTHPPVTIFDRIWAQEVLGEVMRRMRQECDDDAHRDAWNIFEARVLLPITDGVPTPSHEALATRFGLESASHASNTLGTAKRIFRRVFRGVVAEYAEGDSHIDSEIDELWRIFSTPAI